MVFLLVFLCFVNAADAQSTFGSFTGTVTDPSGAVVPGATITVTNTRTQAVRTTVTAGDGTYLLTNLDAGTYQVTMSLSGFADAVQEAILLARQSARVDGRLQLAGASEQVRGLGDVRRSSRPAAPRSTTRDRATTSTSWR